MIRIIGTMGKIAWIALMTIGIILKTCRNLSHALLILLPNQKSKGAAVGLASVHPSACFLLMFGRKEDKSMAQTPACLGCNANNDYDHPANCACGPHHPNHPGLSQKPERGIPM